MYHIGFLILTWIRKTPKISSETEQKYPPDKNKKSLLNKSKGLNKFLMLFFFINLSDQNQKWCA